MWRIAIFRTKRAASFTLTGPVRLRFQSVELKLIVPSPDGALRSEPDASLTKAVIRGHAWWHRRLSGHAQSIADIAATEGINDRCIRRLMGLAFLAPDIIERILDGQQPVERAIPRGANASLMRTP